MSFAGGDSAREYYLHSLMDGSVIFGLFNNTQIDVDGTVYELNKDEYLHLDGCCYFRHIQSNQPILIQTLGRDSWWDNRVENHIVGPQLGLRWYRKASRWTWSTEARFFSGFNQQNIKQQGLLGEGMNPQGVIDAVLDDDEEGVLKMSNMSATAFTHERRFHEWSPAAELRVDLKYQLTRSLSAGVGWTGIWIDGIARSTNTIDYMLGQDTAMGINDHNHEDLFAHGVSARVELNR